MGIRIRGKINVMIRGGEVIGKVVIVVKENKMRGKGKVEYRREMLCKGVCFGEVWF